MRTRSKESATRKKIDLMLTNLGWNTDESSPDCNVFTERAKLVEQDKKFEGNRPDYVLYESTTDSPIAIIEAKRVGRSIDDALKQGVEKYAKPLGVRIIFAIDGTFVKTLLIDDEKPLSIDGELLTELISEKKLLRFLKEGSSIAEVTPQVKYTREELIRIFKWANDRLRKEGLRNLDRFVEFANILFIKIISEIEDERERDGRPRQLDRQLSWDSFAHQSDPKVMLNYINNTVLKNGLAKEYNHSDDIFQERLKIRNPKTVKDIVEKLSELQLLNTESEIKGDAFEYFLKSLASGNDLGEYFTPRHVVRLMVDLLNPVYGKTVFDPFCGTGGFLIEAFRHMKRGIDEENEDLMDVLRKQSIFGIELTDTYKIAKMNMIITGDGHNNIIQGDTAKKEYWKHKDLQKVLTENKITGFDYILSNIPYGQTTDYGNLYPIPSSSGDSIFVQHIIQVLNMRGKAAVIVPEGFLFKVEHKKVREYLLTTCNVEAVISLPAGIFLPYTMSKTDILIFEKGKPTRKVWFYVLENDGYELATKRKRISANDIPDLMSKWQDKPKSSNSWIVEIAKIKTNDYILEARTYKPQAETTEHLTRFSKFLRPVIRAAKVESEMEYKQITVKLHGKGAVLRGVMRGEEILTKRQFIAQENDVVVSKIDARNGAYALIPKELDGGIVSQDFPIYEIDTSQVRPEYLNYFLKYQDFENLLSRDAKGTTNRQRIDSADFLNLEIPVPSIGTQDAVAERLRKQEDILWNLEGALSALKKGFIDESQFDGLKGSRCVAIKALRYRAQYGMTKSVMPDGKGVPYIRITDIDLFGRVRKNLPEVSISKEELRRYRVNEGDLLIARTGATIGKATVVSKLERDTVYASYLIRFVLDKQQVNPKYLLYFLLSGKGQNEILKRANRTTNININANQIGSIEVPLPDSLQAQTDIVAKVEERLLFVSALETNLQNTRDAIRDIIESAFSSVD